MKQLYKVLAVLLLLINVGTASAQYSVGIALSDKDIYPFTPLEGSFGPRLHYDLDSAVVGILTLVQDIKGNTTACDSIAEDLTGKIAVIDRGTCSFVPKCLNAVKKGAVAVIVINTPTGGFGIMGGATDPLAAQISVPCMMVTNADGNDLKKMIIDAAGAPIITFLYHPNNYSNDAYTVTTDRKYYKAPLEDHPFVGFGTLFPENGAVDTLEATLSSYYLYIPDKSGKLDVNSCAGNGDTNINVYESSTLYSVLSEDGWSNKWSNEGACPKNPDDTRNQAAAVTGIDAKLGKAYYIEFNNKNSNDSFYFSLNFAKRDSVDVTFNVDMAQEAAVDAAGVHIAGNFQGWDPAKTPMTNIAGTNKYTATIRVASEQTLEYKFINGNAWGKDESVDNAAPCAAGKDGNRKLIVETEDVVLNTPCFKSCEVCITPKPDLTCDAAAVICDPFKSYSNGSLKNGTVTHWSTWDDSATAGSAYITSDEFASDTKAMKIDGSLTPGQDVVFKAGNVTKGHYKLQWKMLVPKVATTAGTRNHAYFNYQHDLTGSHVFGMEMYLLSNGKFNYYLGGTLQGTGDWTPNTWINVVNDIDIDKDTTIVTIGNSTVGWKWSKASAGSTLTSNKQFAGINFYADSSYAKYYVDDIQLIKFPDAKAKVTFSVDMKNETVDPAKGVCVAGNFQKAAGYANDWAPGITKLVNKTGTSIWELTVELPLGDYEYKFINDDSWSGKEEKMNGKGCYTGDNRTFSLTTLTDTKLSTYCYNKCFACNQQAVTFWLDLSKEGSVSTDGVSIAGSFQDEAGQGADWTPGVIFLKRSAGRIYTTTLGIPAGTYAYKFLNGKAWGKDESVKNTDACAAGSDGNRKLVVGNVDMKLDTVCFKYCVICSKVVATNDAKFDAALNLFPNPTADIVNLAYDFPTATNLTVRVLNILGQTMFEGNMPQVTAGSAVLDVHNYNNGTYMMQITDENNRQTVKRFIIEK